MRRKLVPGAPGILVILLGASGVAAPTAAIEHEVVYRSAGPLHVQIRPSKSGFVAVGYPRVRTDPPELVVTNVDKREVRTLKVLAPPEMARLALRYAEQRNDGSFVASGAWVEKGQSRNGVIRITEEGRVVERTGYGISVGRIAVLDNGTVAATIQPARNPESPDPDEPAKYMLGFFDVESGRLISQNGAGVHQGEIRYREQHRDLVVRSVSAVPGGVVLCQPRTASATWLKTAKNLGKAQEKKRGGDGDAESTLFGPPKEGDYEVIAIAPIGEGGAPEYVVAWARKRSERVANALFPEQKYDEILLAAYRHGGTQKAFAVVPTTVDLWDVVSDGKRVLALAGKAFDWRVEEIRLR